MLLRRDSPQTQRHAQTKRHGKGYFMQLIGRKKAGVAVLLLDKIDFKTKKITGDKEGYYII